MTNKQGFLTRLSITVMFVSIVPVAALAGDESYSSVIKHIKSNYRAKQQGYEVGPMIKTKQT